MTKTEDELVKIRKLLQKLVKWRNEDRHGSEADPKEQDVKP